MEAIKDNNYDNVRIVEIHADVRNLLQVNTVFNPAIIFQRHAASQLTYPFNK